VARRPGTSAAKIIATSVDATYARWGIFWSTTRGLRPRRGCGGNPPNNGSSTLPENDLRVLI
jgi:hypothetical protein